jgi:FkbM family methyltransferase
MHDLIKIPKRIINNNTGIDKITFLVRGVFWAISKRLGFIFTAKLWNGARIKVFPNNSYSPMFYFKYPEGKDMEFLRANAALGDTFVDVGANVGIFSALMADKFSTIVMFEPSDESFHSIKIMANLNKGMAKFELHQIAVSDQLGHLYFLNEQAMSRTNRVVSDARANEENVTVVQADTLDNVLADHFDRIVMKIDIEGSEEKAFSGAHHLLHGKKIKLVMFERLGRTNLEAIKSLLSTCNYRIFRVLDDGKISSSHEDISVPLINLFACPEETYSQLTFLRS